MRRTVTRPALLSRALAGVALLGLSACGVGVGNGGPGSGNGDLASAPGESALVNYLQATHQYTLNATDSTGNSYTIQLSSRPNAAATAFDGNAPAYGTASALTLQLNGAFAGTVEKIDSTLFYLLNPYVPLGTTFSGGTPYGLITGSTPLPATFNVGATGQVYSLTYYHDSTMSVVDASETVTYSIDAYDSETLHACLSYVISDVTVVGGSDGLVPGQREVDCYSIDAAGVATMFSISLMVSAGETLTFT